MTSRFCFVRVRASNRAEKRTPWPPREEWLIAEWPEGDWVPYAAVRLSLMLTTTDFSDDRIPTQSWYLFTPGLVGGLKYRVTHHWFVSGRLRLQYLPYNVDGNKGFGFGEFATLMGYEL